MSSDREQEAILQVLTHCVLAARYPCIYCGPPTKYDFEKVEQDNEDEAYMLMDNFKAAVANKCGHFLHC